MEEGSARKPTYRNLLRTIFGFDDFRPGQERVLRALHAQGASLAVFPTGGGKSLCYQLPALNYAGVTVVVSPLIALMKDQIDYLRSKGVAAARMDSSLAPDEMHAVNRSLADGSLKILYVAPERFNNERFVAQMRRTPISLFAIDEAHCISEWGHNFRPDYLKLADIVRDIGAERVLALTATATPPVVRDICAAFGIPDDCAIVTGFYRSNLNIHLTPLRSRDRDSMLCQRLKERPVGPTIVYVTLQKTAERVAMMLDEASFAAKAYHAGMETDERTTVQEWWMASDRGIVVATIAFGMGIDKSDVRYIYHYNLPKGLESYSQEIGRAGRDGRASLVEMFACRTDLPTVENFAYGDTPTEDSIRGVVTEILSAGEEFDVSQYDLSYRHDMRALVLKTLLTYLELLGVIHQGTPFYASYSVRLQVPKDEIVGQFSGEPGELLKRVFASGTRGTSKGAVRYRINPDETAAALQQERRRIIRALEVLEERRLVEITPSEVRQRFRRVGDQADIETLVADLTRRFQRRETQTIEGAGRVLDLVTHEGCQTNALAAYFGEVRAEACGHCTFCGTGKVAVLPAEPELPPIESEVNPADLQRLRAEFPEVLKTARQTARLLCGLSSPATGKARLTRHALYGSCEHQRFHDVLSWIERSTMAKP